MEGAKGKFLTPGVAALVGCLFMIQAIVPVANAAPTSALPADQIDGDEIWRNARQLETLGESFPAFRCAGSGGANASASWIHDQFTELGYETWYEEFQFWGWDLLYRPEMMVAYADEKGVHTRILETFQVEQFSYPSTNATFADLVLLPLPSTASPETFSDLSYDDSWASIDISGKVVLVGREVRWNLNLEHGLVQKLEASRPRALVYYYSQVWTTPWEKMFMGSSGGRPLSDKGDYLFSNYIPVGHLDVQDSDWLLGQMNRMNVSARLRIDSRSGNWAQRNVVAKLPGSVETGPMVLLTAHYDSVMTPGFCDNAASVSTMLEVAKAIKVQAENGDYKPTSTILFVAFTGEEMDLVGSAYYYSSHAEEMARVKAVINLDCLGAATFSYSSTNDEEGLDLEQRVMELATEMGVQVRAMEGSSDQQTFIDPQSVIQSVDSYWGISPSMPEVVNKVESSIGLFSGPLVPQDIVTYGQLGWIHTSRDSSDYSFSSGWITNQSLEEQAKVVRTLLMEVAGTEESAGGYESLTVFVVISLLLVTGAVSFYFLSRRMR